MANSLRGRLHNDHVQTLRIVLISVTAALLLLCVVCMAAVASPMLGLVQWARVAHSSITANNTSWAVLCNYTATVVHHVWAGWCDNWATAARYAWNWCACEGRILLKIIVCSLAQIVLSFVIHIGLSRLPIRRNILIFSGALDVWRTGTRAVFEWPDCDRDSDLVVAFCVLPGCCCQLHILG